MQTFVDTAFSSVDAEAFTGIRFVCTSPVTPPTGFEAIWSSIDPQTDVGDEPGLSAAALQTTRAMIAVSDVASMDEQAALFKFASWACTIRGQSMHVLLLPRPHASGLRAEESLSSTLLILESGCFDDVLWGAPTGFALALTLRAKLVKCDLELDRAKDEYERRVKAKAIGDRVLAMLETTCWEHLPARSLRFIPQRQESAQLDEQSDRVAGLRIGKSVMRWLFGHVHRAVPPAQVGDLAARGAGAGELGVGEDGVDARTAHDHAPAPVADVAAGHRAQQLVQGGEMTTLFMIKKRDVKSFSAVWLINRYLQVMTDLTQVPHPNLPQLVRAMQSPTWLYVQLQQRGAQSLFCALKKRRDAALHGTAAAPIETTTIVDVVHQLAQALQHLHEIADIAHRDIKPEVVLLDVAAGPDGAQRAHATLSGFELASRGRRVLVPCGTMPFVAPEVAVAGFEGYDGMKADMWSFGVMVLELVCGLKCVELAVAAFSEGGSGEMSISSAAGPSGEFDAKFQVSTALTGQIKQLFDRPDCINVFLAKSVPEAAPLKGWLASLFAGVLRLPPQLRFEASELLRVLRVRQTVQSF